MRVPFFKLSIDEEEIDQVIKVMRKGYMTQGREVRVLEKEFCKYVGARYAVAVDSCTSGLFLSLKCAGVGNGDIVSIPSLTFASVANVILHCGGKINWLDEIYVGHAYPLNTSRPLGIIDSAHQVERAMMYDFPDSLVNFSFYPTKQISSCEGGMICLNDHASMEWLEKARWHGRKGGGYNYVIDIPGWKMNMTDVQAVIALIQLTKLDDMNAKRKEIVEYYNRELGENCQSLHLYTITTKHRDNFIQYMDSRGINCSVHFYTPLHKQPAYSEFKAELPFTDDVSQKIVSLPLYPDMTQAEVDYVIKHTKEWRAANV
jgi:dTDP-4-amino-4,6-dideoxygalactose transaminase